jgi:hypothetical protein
MVSKSITNVAVVQNFVIMSDKCNMGRVCTKVISFLMMIYDIFTVTASNKKISDLTGIQFFDPLLWSPTL